MRGSLEGGSGAGAGGGSNRSRSSPIDRDAAGMRVALPDNMRPPALLVLSWLLFASEGAGDLLRDSVHVTSAAARPPNELWCYRCFAEDSDDRCANLTKHNSSALIHKCTNDRRLCMVKRFSYTTSTENSTSTLRMWALERNCTKHCEPGCIIIGERTKLYACTSCCDTSLCNSGSGAEYVTPLPLLYITMHSIIILVNSS